MEDLKDPESKKSSLPPGALATIVGAKYGGIWRGVNIMKDCMTLNLLHNLFYYLQPKTVLDFGSWTGASAMYMADQLDLLGVKDYKVFSYDITHDSLHPKAKADERIKYIQASLKDYKELFTLEFMSSLEHPIFISEDAHVNTVELLTHLNQFLKKRDFVIIEDMHPETPDDIDMETDEIKSQKELDNSKEYTLFGFLEKNPEWRVDNYFASYFGKYSTTNGYAYLARLE